MIRNDAVAVTGATGFVGRVLVERLLADRPVRALVRTGDQRTARWAKAGGEVVRGSLEDNRALAALVAGVDTVFHCAATMGKGDADLSQRVNVAGTEAVARAALGAGVRRFVYVSSISVFAATRQPDGIITESIVPRNTERLNHYGRTKYGGEMRVRALGVAEGLEYTIVRPTNIYGPGSGPWFHQFERLLRRLPVAIGNLPIDVVYVDDVVESLIGAARSAAASGQTFHIGHEMIRMSDFIRRVGEVTGRRAHALPRVADWLVRRTIDGVYRSATSRHMSLSLVRPTWYPHHKARATFGYEPGVGVDEGFRRLGCWYTCVRDQGEQISVRRVTAGP